MVVGFTEYDGVLWEVSDDMCENWANNFIRKTWSKPALNKSEILKSSKTIEEMEHIYPQKVSC